MDVVSAGGFAEDDGFEIGGQGGEADGAVAFDGFALGGVRGRCVGCGGDEGGGWGRGGEDFAELLESSQCGVQESNEEAGRTEDVDLLRRGGRLGTGGVRGL